MITNNLLWNKYSEYKKGRKCSWNAEMLHYVWAEICVVWSGMAWLGLLEMINDPHLKNFFLKKWTWKRWLAARQSCLRKQASPFPSILRQKRNWLRFRQMPSQSKKGWKIAPFTFSTKMTDGAKESRYVIDKYKVLTFYVEPLEMMTFLFIPLLQVDAYYNSTELLIFHII